MRILNQSLEMHTINPSKTPFFDTLSTSSYGYGGEPNNMSYLRFSKGKLYDFSGSFRRDRNYYDYNLMPNSFSDNGHSRYAGPGSAAEFAAYLQHRSAQHRPTRDAVSGFAIQLPRRL